jgi:branched-chain amino acid transport system ATP-binding protein
MKTMLKTESVSKDFSGLQVLSDINLEIFEGEKHAIIGPNGSGKSTLFNIITGLYKPSRGSIFFLNKDITHLAAHKIVRLGLSRSFQITSIFPKMTVFENIRNAVVSKFNRRADCVTLLSRSQKIRNETNRIIDLLDLDEVRDSSAAEMSYGWQRRVELALALAWDPFLIMLDEPTAGVDIEHTRGFVELIKHVTQGKTLVIIEHDMDVVFDLADRITVLNLGKVLTTGTCKEIIGNPEVRDAYMGRKSSAPECQ